MSDFVGMSWSGNGLDLHFCLLGWVDIWNGGFYGSCVNDLLCCYASEEAYPSTRPCMIWKDGESVGICRAMN